MKHIIIPKQKSGPGKFIVMLIALITLAGFTGKAQNTFQKKINFPATCIEKAGTGECIMAGGNSGALGAFKYDQWGNFQSGNSISSSAPFTLYNSEKSAFRNVHLFSCSMGAAMPTYIRMDSTWQTSGITFLPQLPAMPISFHEDKNKNLYMVMSHDSDMFFGDAVIIKTTSGFQPLWKTLVDLPQIYGETHPIAACITHDSSIILTGWMMKAVFLIKISSQGILVWDKYYESNNPNQCESFYPVSVFETSSKKIVISGNSYDLSNFNHMIIELDSAGLNPSSVIINHASTPQTMAENISEAANGDYILKGSKNWGDTTYVLRMNAGGTILWGKEYLNNMGPMGGVGNGYYYRTFIEDQNGDLLFLCKNSSQESILTRTDAGGSINCYTQNASFTTSSISLIQTTRPLQIFNFNCSNSTPILNQTVLTVPDSTLCIPTTINETENSLGVQVFPNPFSAQTTLQTDNLLHNATLTVYNCFGQTVAQIKNISGQTVTFHRDNLASGLYFLRLTEDNKIFTDKLIITDN